MMWQDIDNIFDFNLSEDEIIELLQYSADEATLKTVKRKSKEQKYRAFIAVYAESIRLIDNIGLN